MPAAEAVCGCDACARVYRKCARLRVGLCATMIRGDPRRLQHHDVDHGGRLIGLVDGSFASACQAVRTNKELCPYGCAKLLAPRTIDYHRLNGCRGKHDDAFADVSRKRSFICGACYDEFVTRDAFFQHLNSEHAVEAAIRECVFPDYHSFERFRFWLEAQGGAHFRQKSGAKTRPSGKGIFMMCNRSGLVHTTAPTGEPDRDKLGSYRMGYSCTAFINGTVYQDGHVSVRYCGDHYGHDARVRLPQSVKNIIMHMQTVGRTNTMIIRYLQDHFIPFGPTSIHAQRAAYVDLEELRSITPMLRRLTMIPFEKEEEWEQEFLETAGIIREWAPPPRVRPHDWLPIKEFAEKMNWVPPLVFKAKVRNAAGDWMVFNEEQQVYEPEATARSKLQHYLEDLDDLDDDHHYGRQKVEQRRGGGGRGGGGGLREATAQEEREQEEEEEMVDVEELREAGKEEGEPSQPGPSTSASTAGATAAAKKPRLEERGGEGGGGRRRMDEEEAEADEGEGAANGRQFGARSGFLASSIVAELEMIKALVKAESEFLSDAELAAYLRQTRDLRLSFEPLSRGAGATVGRGAIGQREFAVPQLARPSRALPIRGRTRALQSRGVDMRSTTEALRFGSGGGWPSSSSSSMHLQKRGGGGGVVGGGGAMMLDPHDIDVCDEEVVVGTTPAAAATKLQYNSRLWS